MPPDLENAYAIAQQLTKQHGKTYYFSTCFFPKELQKHVYALYGFVRYPDELVDNPTPGSDPKQQLESYRAATISSLKGECHCLPVLDAFAATAKQFKIPIEYPLAFLDAMAMDLTVKSYQTFDDLTKYTYGSASVVGLMMCHLIGATCAEALGPAHDLGLAMQLTNFLRDIGEDYRERERIYIPQEDMKKYGYTLDDLKAGVINDKFRALMQYEIARARRYFESADNGMKFIPSCHRLPIKLARVLYSRILNKIEENNYNVFTKRAATSSVEKVATLMQEAMQCRLER